MCAPTTLQHLYLAQSIMHVDEYIKKHNYWLGSVLVCAPAHRRPGAWFDSHRMHIGVQNIFPKIETVAFICRRRRLVHPTYLHQRNIE